MGEAWLALQYGAEGFVKPVVIKKLRGQIYRDQLIREGRILSHLHHPKLLQVIALEENQGQLNLVLEWVNGFTLQQLISLSQRHLLPKAFYEGFGPLGALSYVIYDVLAALEYCHNRNPPIIHGDVTPSNILISKQGVVKLADFGIARFIPLKSRKDGNHLATRTSRAIRTRLRNQVLTLRFCSRVLCVLPG